MLCFYHLCPVPPDPSIFSPLTGSVHDTDCPVRCHVALGHWVPRLVPACISVGLTPAFMSQVSHVWSSRARTTDGAPIADLEEMKGSGRFPGAWRGTRGPGDGRTKLSGGEPQPRAEQPAGHRSPKHPGTTQCRLTPGDRIATPVSKPECRPPADAHPSHGTTGGEGREVGGRFQTRNPGFSI